MPPQITFTRSTSGTRVNQAGLIESVTANQPRFDYDPITLACKGLLVEEQRTNLLTYSEQFDNAVWAKTRCSVSANATTAPDGTLTADKLVEDTSAEMSHYTSQAISHTGSHTLSLYAKSAGANGVIIWAIGTSSFAAGFNLSSGASYIESISGPSSPDISTTISNIGSGWYRCSISFNAVTGSSIRIAIDKDTNGDGIYTGDGTSGIYLWGAQLEAGSFPTSYIPTTSAQVTRAADVAVMTGTNFSSWYNQSEGTFYAQISSPNVTKGQRNGFLFPPSAILFYTLNSASSLRSYDGSANITTGGSVSADSPFSAALAYSATGMVQYKDGALAGSSAGYDGDFGSSLNIGGGGSNALNGHIRRFAFFPRKFSNAELQALTS